MVQERLKYLERAAILSRFIPHVLSSRRSREGKDESFAESFYDFMDHDLDDSSLYEVLSTRNITYVTPIGTVFGVEVAREVEITLTKERFGLCAADLGAFPFQPGETANDEHVWFDAKLLDHYVQLHHRKAFVSHTHLEDAFNRLTGVIISRKEWSRIVRQYRATVRPSETSDLKHFGVDLPEEMQTDPFRDCPACAIVSEYEGELDTDEADKKYAHMPLDGMKDERLRLLDEVGRSPRTSIQVVSADAVAKAVRFKLNRPTDVQSELLCSDYLLPLERLINPMGSVAQTVDEDGDTECEQRIRASRNPDANIAGSSKLAEHCVCAAICPHGIVPRKGVMSSDKPEHFGLYFAILMEIIKFRMICFVCIDNGCQVGPSWCKRFPDLVAQQPMMAFTTGSWHGAAHKLSCRLRSSMTFQTGAGRRHGENTEHLWSHLKPAWKSLKYMNYANHKFGLEEAIWGWVCAKRDALLNQFQHWMDKLPEKYSSLLKKCAALSQELHEQGLDDEKIIHLTNRFRSKALGIPCGESDLAGEDEAQHRFFQGMMEFVKYTEKAKYFRRYNPVREAMTPYGKLKQDAATVVDESESKARAALKAYNILEDALTTEAYSDALLKHYQQEVALSRVEVENLFESRHAMYKSESRAIKHGEITMSRQCKRQLTINKRHIYEWMFIVQYWEEAHCCHVDPVSHRRYEPYKQEDIDSWMRKHDDALFFPPWRQLMGKDDMPVDLRQDGCESATIRHLIICLMVCLEDMARTKEEARFLPLELRRIEFFYLHRKRILTETLDDIQSELKQQEVGFPDELVDCEVSQLFCESGCELITFWLDSQLERRLLPNFHLRVRAHGIRKLLHDNEMMLRHPMLNTVGNDLVRKLENEVV